MLASVCWLDVEDLRPRRHAHRRRQRRWTVPPAGDIHVGGLGRFDYLAVDSPAKRLYLSHGTEVVVIDTTTNTIVGRIPDTPGVHGIAIAPNGKGFITAGQENKVAIFDLKTMKVSMKVNTGADLMRSSTSRSTRRSTRSITPASR